MKRWPLALLFLGTACGGEVAPDSGVAKVRLDAATELAPTRSGIAQFLRLNGHRGWIAEPAIHSSKGPHGRVRTFFSEKYLAARRADRYPMPIGAMAVKELYDNDFEQERVNGYAVAVKTSSGADANTWTWWEGFITDLEQPPYSGVAVSTCENCHKGTGSKDRSLTETVPQ